MRLLAVTVMAVAAIIGGGIYIYVAATGNVRHDQQRVDMAYQQLQRSIHRLGQHPKR